MALLCSRCGTDLPPLPDDLAKIAQTRAVVLAHEPGQCPNEKAAPPAGRYFEVRVAIVEVSEQPDSASGPITVGVQVDELASFKAGVTAPDLEAAMRPLAEALGVKWLRVEEHARLADPQAST